MRKYIGFIGRLSLLILVAMFVEGMATLGNAFTFEAYSAIECVAQTLLFCCLVWCASEWQHASESK